MQNEFLKSEIEKNKENIFMSSSLQDIVEDDNVFSVKRQSDNVFLYIAGKDLLSRCIVQNLSGKDDKIKINFISNDFLLQSFLKKEIEKVYVEFNQDILKEFDMTKYSFSYCYKGKLEDIYTYKLKLVRNKNGI